MNTEQLSNTIADAANVTVVNGAAKLANEDALQAEIARLKAENAALNQPKPAAKKPEPEPAQTVASKGVCSGLGYPANATAIDKLILDAIHANKAKPDPKYPVQACFGTALYWYFHVALIPNLSDLIRAGKDKEAKAPIDTKLTAFIKSARDRGIVTRIWRGKFLYYDRREMPEDATSDHEDTRTPSSHVKDAIRKAFAA